ncbi:hypothetical protein V6N13_127475 [Hibiscus sabdariffa]|uniref:Uncharacterized protein n=1 Tax=Hibiscus sabdariffa TaxID=183260 RepID=A0ABR2RCH9_9ROSI
MNGSGNEKLALAIDDERAAVVSHIAGKRRAEQRSKETKQGKKEGGDFHHFFWKFLDLSFSLGFYGGKKQVDESDSDEFMCISVGIARGVQRERAVGNSG